MSGHGYDYAYRLYLTGGHVLDITVEGVGPATLARHIALAASGDDRGAVTGRVGIHPTGDTAHVGIVLTAIAAWRTLGKPREIPADDDKVDNKVCTLPGHWGCQYEGSPPIFTHHPAP